MTDEELTEVIQRANEIEEALKIWWMFYSGNARKELPAVDFYLLEKVTKSRKVNSIEITRLVNLIRSYQVSTE